METPIKYFKVCSECSSTNTRIPFNYPNTYIVFTVYVSLFQLPITNDDVTLVELRPYESLIIHNKCIPWDSSIEIVVLSESRQVRHRCRLLLLLLDGYHHYYHDFYHSGCYCYHFLQPQHNKQSTPDRSATCILVCFTINSQCRT